MTPYGTRSSLEIAALDDGIEAVPARCPYCFSHLARTCDGLCDPRSTFPWRIAHCVDCSQLFTSPRPREIDWHRFYREDYPPHQVKRPSPGWRRALRGWFRECVPMGKTANPTGKGIPKPAGRPNLAGQGSRRLVLPRVGESMLLDVGCGAGSYLARMRSLGWDVLGLDRSRRAADLARTRFGVPVIVGTLPTDELPTGEFDLVTLWQVFEHLDRPRQALACIRELLRPGGRLMLTVPNQDSWAARTFGAAWIGLDLPRHLTHFTPRTLARMLSAERFDIIRITTTGQSGWIRHSARAFPIGSNLRWLTSKLLSRITSGLAVARHAGETIHVLAAPA